MAPHRRNLIILVVWIGLSSLVLISMGWKEGEEESNITQAPEPVNSTYVEQNLYGAGQEVVKVQLYADCIFLLETTGTYSGCVCSRILAIPYTKFIGQGSYYGQVVGEQAKQIHQELLTGFETAAIVPKHFGDPHLALVFTYANGHRDTLHSGYTDWQSNFYINGTFLVSYTQSVVPTFRRLFDALGIENCCPQNDF